MQILHRPSVRRSAVSACMRLHSCLRCMSTVSMQRVAAASPSPGSERDAVLRDLAAKLAQAKAKQHFVSLQQTPTTPQNRVVDASALPTSLSEAYFVQGVATDLLVNEHGYKLAGWKVGAASAVSQQLLGLDGPFLGPMFSSDHVHTPARVSSDFNLRGAEAEFLFTMGAELPLHPGQEFTYEEVQACTQSCCPALEIVGHHWRLETKDVTTNMTIADFVSSNINPFLLEHALFRHSFGNFARLMILLHAIIGFSESIHCACHC